MVRIKTEFYTIVQWFGCFLAGFSLILYVVFRQPDFLVNMVISMVVSALMLVALKMLERWFNKDVRKERRQAEKER